MIEKLFIPFKFEMDPEVSYHGTDINHIDVY